MKKSTTLNTFVFLIFSTIFVFSSFSTINNKYYGNGYSSSYLKSFKGDNVKVYSLKEGYSEIGHSIWLSRGAKKMNAVYFSEGDVYGKHKKWSNGKDVFLTCSGAFSDDLNKTAGALPVGINVENGYVKNRTVIKEGMDALVVVYATGGIVVSDLTKGDLFLKSLGKEVNIRKDVSAKYDFLDWAKKEKATVFQTQLLAYKNELKIDYQGRKQKRERRFLALATTNSGTLYHIIFNLPNGVYLYDGTKNVLDHLKDQNMDVTAILNLDTGAYNVLQVNTGDYAIDSHLKGATSISSAVNLLSYHYN
ncbi:hypothetical protein [Aureispira sp. CCB-QB1]|uniref:hypothetical protein n=1 Tax=Aureispira sp. CCB-QB1 TaxID=1313421 RepID=UPI000698E35D|nr:hypothetical protein [Aureispira sp. CCB-QB1]